MIARSRGTVLGLTMLAGAAGVGLFPGQAAGTTYYVDATRGRDTNDGTTTDGTTRRGPWQSIARVHQQALAPGDTVLLKRRELWRETLVLSWSGAPGQPITIGSYGRGVPPIISGADVVAAWTVSDSVRHIYTAWLALEPAVAYFNATRGRRRAGIDLLTEVYDWCWTAEAMHVRMGADDDVIVEAGARGAAVVIAGQSHITVQDILVERTNGSGLYVDTSAGASSDLVIQRVVARDSRFAGMTFKNGDAYLKTTRVRISGNRVYGNGASGINVSEGVNDVTIANNVSHHNNWSGDLYEAGIRVWGRQIDGRNLVVEHNETYGMVSDGRGWQNGHGIWLDEVAPGAVLRGNYSHDNGSIGLFIEHSDRAAVYDNLAVNNRDASIMLYRGVHDNQIYNNTVYGGATGIRLAGGGEPASVTGNSVRNNISAGAAGPRLMAGDGGENDGLKGSANMYQHNCLGSERAGLVVWGYWRPMIDTYQAWDAAYGSRTDFVEGDPRFVSATDFHVRPDSPCLHIGMTDGVAPASPALD